MSLSNQTVFKATVFLKSSIDWDEWILVVNLLADRYGISDYVDLDKPEKPEPKEPDLPDYSDVKQGATKLTDLDASQKVDLNMLMDRHKIALRTIKTKLDALKLLDTHIISTVDRTNMMHLMGMKTAYQKLKSLKSHIAPTDRIRKLEVFRKYRSLQKTPKQQQIAQWISDWEKAYDDAVRISIPDIDGTAPLYDFLNTIRPIEDSYVAAQESLIEYSIKRGDSTITMKELLENLPKIGEPRL